MSKKWLICTFLIIYSFTFGYSEQVVVSQFDIGLKNSNTSGHDYKYSLTGVTKSEDIKAVTSTDLSTVIDFNGAIGQSFTGEQSNLTYLSSGQKSIIIPVKKNESTSVATGAFQLTEATTVSGESALTYLIQDNITLPAKTIVLSQDTTVSTGVKFTYTDSAKALHLSAYKMQKFMIRIAKSSISDTNYDIVAKSNGIQLANSTNILNGTSYAQSFLDGNTGYIDFLVTADQYDKAQSISTDVGLSLKFMPEDIEVLGLPKGNYRIELYSFRYSKEVTTKGNVVITKEDNKSFSVGNTEFLENGIDIMNFSSSEFTKIKATILTVGNTTSPSIVVSEDGIVMTANITATSGAIYVDSASSGALGISTGGTFFSGKYYQLWDVVYTTPNSTINTTARQVGYKMNTVHEARTNYNVISSTAQYTSEPLYQTVFAGFKDTTFSIGTFEIEDRTVNKYSDGYRSVRTANVNLTGTAIDMATLYKGNASSYAAMSSTINPYNWTGSTATEGNSLIISKVMSDSKGTFQNINDKSKNFIFYTTNWKPNIVYKESGAVLSPTGTQKQATDTVNFSWTAPSNTSYNTTVSQDKVIFRIIKATSDSEILRYKPDSNSNPIIESNDTNLINFLNDTTNTKYFDLVFTSGEDKQVTINNTVFNFSKDNTLKITGLKAEVSFKLQIYALQNEDITAKQDSNYDYRVLTYGSTSEEFIMGKPLADTGDYATSNNFYFIDGINVKSSLVNNIATKDVQVGVIIKADRVITSTAISVNNLKAVKSETSSSSLYLNYPTDKMREAWNPTYTTSTGAWIYNGTTTQGAIIGATYNTNNITSVTPSAITVEKAVKENFQYPLDIVFLLDDSASMDNEIINVKSNLKTFADTLKSKGYDVNFNVITFGPKQDTNRLKNGLTPWTKKDSDYLAIFKDGWYTTYNTQTGTTDQIPQLETDIGKISAGNGYRLVGTPQQENGMWAMHYGIEMLTNKGRYLNKNYGIWKTSDGESNKYLPSKKWIILLTDENADSDYISGMKSYDEKTTETYSNDSTNSNYVISKLSTKMKVNDINFTGIFHIDTIKKDNTLQNDYINKINTIKNSDNSQKYIASDNSLWTMKNDNYYSYLARTGYSTNTYGISIKDSLGHTGDTTKFTNEKTPDGYPSDLNDLSYTDFALQGLGNLFNMYEMGGDGSWTGDALLDSVKNIGIIQRWNINYRSPYGKSDGNLRESVFSITGTSISLTNKIKQEQRVYIVPTQNIEAYFVSPDETVKQLEKTQSGILLKAKAQSQYKNLKTNQWENYPITKGTFMLTGIKSDDGTIGTETVSMSVSSDGTNEYGKVDIEDKTENSSTWYYASSTLSTSKFNAKFGKKPKNLVITFIAETTEDSKTITLSGVTVVDKIAPKITAIKMTNITLANLMRELKSDSVTRAFTDEAVTSAAVRVQNQTEAENTTGTGIVALSTDSALNVKAGDSVEIGVVIDDESITYTSGTVQIGYGNAADNFTTATCVSVNITSDSAISTWKATIPIVNSATAQDEIVKNITYKVIDGSSSPNTRIVSGNAFNQPALLDNVSLEPNSSNPAESEYSNYYTLTANQISSNDKTNGALVNIQNEVANTLGYIVVFNYNTVNIDAGDPTKTYGNHSTNANLKYEAIGNSDFPTIMDGKFRFGAGEYTYNGTVYVINSAGAIKSITSSTVNSLDNIINGIGVGTARFYVDTIAPVVKSIQLEKTADVNSELNSPSLPETNSLYNIIHGIIGETVTVTGGTDYKRPFKAGDNLSLIGTIIEKNIAKSLIGGENIFTDNNLGIITGTESYSKTGIAKDLGEQINQLRDVIIYDKAGNKAIYLTDKTTSELTTNKIQLEIVYDDRTPNNLETKASIVNGVDIVGSVDEVSTKFTKEPTLPLTSTENGVPLSLVIVDSNIYGDVRKGTGTLSSFGYSITTDKLYEPIITTYSYSGIKGETVEDTIILDTVVGSLDSSVNLKSTVANITVANLNDIFNGIFEMVGLSKYSIDTNSTEVSGIQLGGVDYTKGTLRVLTGAPYYQVASKPNPANIIGGSNFTFNVPSGGSYTFIITVYDRLGNFKNISYSVEIPNNVNIIGKKSGISKVISTKVNNSTKKMKIQSRAE